MKSSDFKILAAILMRHSLVLLTLIFLCSCKDRKVLMHHPITINEFETCKSKDCLERSIKSDPKNVNAYWRLGTIYQSEKNYAKALNYLTIAIQLDPSYNLGFPYRDRANCKNNLRNDTGAVNDMNEAIKLNPDERYFYVDRGDYLYNLEKFDLALNDYSKALSIFDKHTPARFGRAKTYVQLKEYRKALQDYDTLTDTSEYSAYDFYYRGIARFNMNDKINGCKDWKIVSKLCPEAKDSLDKYCNGD
ncbi:MAG TPA: tetratricopeptide repeat protein [Chitinophagales bacterium]|nr:tetratricopeptide repeat protein [Chitinophagales bacterium]